MINPFFCSNIAREIFSSVMNMLLLKKAIKFHDYNLCVCRQIQIAIHLFLAFCVKFWKTLKVANDLRPIESEFRGNRKRFESKSETVPFEIISLC